MKQPRQPGLFDVEERAAQLTEMGDPLVGLKARINWEAFRPELNRVHDKVRKSKAGAKPFDVVLMFKLLAEKGVRKGVRLLLVMSIVGNVT